MKSLVYFSLFLVTFFGNFSYAQNSVIDSVKLVNQNPVEGDIIFVVVYATHTSSNCELVSHNALISFNTTIELQLNYNVGAALAICHSVDTISLGNLVASTYNLTGEVTVNDSLIGTSGELTFVVGTPSLGINMSKSETNLTVSALIKDGKLLINGNKEMHQAEVLNLMGQRILMCEMNGQDNTEVAFNLPSGIYIIRAVDKHGGNYSAKFFAGI